MKKVGVFFGTGYEEIEALTVVDLLRRVDVETVCISIDNQKQVMGAHNILVEMDAGIDEIDFNTLDMIVCPGGMPGTKNLEACSKLTEQIKRFYENGKLIGHNTDGIGYMKAVQHAGLDLIGKKMTLLGAGGAATAILVQAALDGVAEISVFSRPGKRFDQTLETIAQLRGMSSCNIHLYDFSDETILRREIQESALLTNATSVGMAPNTEASLVADLSIFHKDLVVSDIIYNPKETTLLKLAKEAGCQTFNGLYMLLYQGAEAFKLWAGEDMPVDAIKKAYFE